MNVYDFAEQILFGKSLEDKLIHHRLQDFNYDESNFSKKILLPKLPERDQQIKISEVQAKFPKKSTFHLDDKKAMALHFFANHELLAIEMMAAAILTYDFENPEEKKQFHKGLVKTIIDEQKHLKLYTNRMKEWKLNLGDLPLNDFFWNYMPELKTPSMFYAAMALTFESANLDFANYYSLSFKEVGDDKTAEIMRIVYEDEISHVALGAKWLNQWRNDKDLWTYYQENLPALLTPNRAKGIHYREEYRKEAGLDDHFCQNLTAFEDGFRVTKRKTWGQELPDGNEG